MLYFNSNPRIHGERVLKGPIVIDQGQATSLCTDPKQEIYVERELKLAFDNSDITWLVFVSQPMRFTSQQFDAATDERNQNLSPGQVSGLKSAFALTAINRVYNGMVRVAMSNTFWSEPGM